MGAGKSDTYGICPLCKRKIRRPSAARWGHIAHCPFTGRTATGARGPYFTTQDGHKFALAERNVEALAARSPGFFRRVWIALGIAARTVRFVVTGVAP